jgi:hypothetical protein
MKPNSSTKTPDISDDAPRLKQADFDRATFRLGGKPISRADWQASVRARVVGLGVFNTKGRIHSPIPAPVCE